MHYIIAKLSIVTAFIACIAWIVSLLFFNTRAMTISGTVLAGSVLTIFICMLIDIVTSFRWWNQYKQKVFNVIAIILFIGSIYYILGQYGSLEVDRISIKQFIIRVGIGLIILGFDTWLINYVWKEDKLQ